MMDTIRVTIDGETWFTARADVAERWNGWLACPWFTRLEAERVAAWLEANRAAEVARYGESEGISASWDGDTLVLGDPSYDVVERLDAVDGYYAIGAYGWVWSDDDDA